MMTWCTITGPVKYHSRTIPCRNQEATPISPTRTVIPVALLFAVMVVAGGVFGEDVSMPDDNTEPTGVETVPPKTKPVEFQVTNWMLILLVVVILSGAMATYMPHEVRRMRIQSAQREYMDARLALAQGDFTTALVGFDSAIDEAQRAYTRRDRVNGPAEWVLMPDEFYINLWRGRAHALRGIGRERLAQATLEMAEELEASMGNGAAVI